MKHYLFGMLAVLLAGCAAPPPEVDPAYRAEIELWRERRVERLIAEDGWLSVVGLYWLKDGVNRFGSNPSNEVVLDAPGVPALAGTLEVSAAGVVARAAAGAGVTINDEPFVESVVTTDAQGHPDLFGTGRLTWYVIERSGRLGVRVKDPESDARRSFDGIQYFPIDPRYRVTATLERYDEPRTVEIPTVIGDPTSMLAPGLLRFTLGDDALSLEPYVGSTDDDSYFLIFRDRTSGDTSYRGGRFLGADAVGEDGTTTLDFNYAYNPPCAFTAYATCPLPPPQNSLPVAIEAGERYGGPHH